MEIYMTWSSMYQRKTGIRVFFDDTSTCTDFRAKLSLSQTGIFSHVPVGCSDWLSYCFLVCK
jgi:hypothetical protein